MVGALPLFSDVFFIFLLFFDVVFFVYCTFPCGTAAGRRTPAPGGGNSPDLIVGDDHVATGDTDARNRKRYV